ncbi:MAG: hypothetical protein ABSE56_13035 [Bryobacteraceae bacterium]|jgi:uncharacterized membrane protein YgcG
MRRVLLVLPAFCLTFPCHAQDYEISRYFASFRLIPGSADVDVQLDITYDILAGQKSDGFKYTGDYEPVNARGTDDRGGSIPVVVEHRREYMVYWTFPPVGLAQKGVSIQFRLRDVLSGTRSGGNLLSADWVGVFKIPVRRAVYEVVFPPGIVPPVPEGFSRSQVGGCEVFTLIQKPLTQRKLSLRFTPGLVDAARNRHPDPEWFLVFVIFGVIVALVLGLQLAASTRGESGGLSGGGCGGGGCGGGGCGGGCGG